MRRNALFTATMLAGLLLAAVVSNAQAEASAYRVVDRLHGPDGKWDYASFDSARRRVYIAHGAAITAVDVDSGAVIGALAKGEGLHQVFALPGGKALFATNGAANTVTLIDADTGALISTIPVGKKPDAAIFDPATGLVAVMNGGGGDVSLVDPDARRVVGTMPVGGVLEYGVADGSGRVYVNIEDKGEIAVLDLKARSVVARYPLPGCVEPSGMIYAKDAGLLISACANGVAKAVRAVDGTVTATLNIGRKPDATLWDEDRKLAFIPAGADGVLNVIAVKGPADVSVVGTVKTQVGARTGALDPKTGRIYLPVAKLVAPKGGGRPQPVPGTFEVLVVAPN